MNTMDLNMQTSRLPDPSAATLPFTRHPGHRQLRQTAFRHSTLLLGLALGVFLLAGCADFGPSSSRDDDGVYQVTATPTSPSSSEIRCAPFTEDVVVRDGRVDSVTHSGVLGDSADESCQWGYRAQYEGTANDGTNRGLSVGMPLRAAFATTCPASAGAWKDRASCALASFLQIDAKLRQSQQSG